MLTIIDLLRWRAELHPNDVALVDEAGLDGRRDQVTYGELYERVQQCARFWQERGVEPGDVVALLDTNSIAFAVNMFGLGRLGAIPALLNWRLTAVEHKATFDLIKPVAVAASDSFVDQLPADLPNIRVVLGSRVRALDGWLDEDGAGVAAAGVEGKLPPAPKPDSVFALGFSSGTTGRSKGIPLRHESLARSAIVDSIENTAMHHGARHLMVAPMFHLAGLSNSLMALACGAEIHLRSRFEPSSVLDDIEEWGIEYLTAVPAMFGAMVAAAGQREQAPDTSSMEEMSYGASPIAPELIREITTLFPTTRLRQFYGMTEVAGALTTLHPADHDPSRPHSQSAGQVPPGFEVRLVDRDGRDVPDGEPGQILARGTSVFHGYWNDPEATKEAFIDGWFATGDIATRSDGYLTILDRAKDMIVSGGENVYPAEVEAALYEHPGVADAAVIGVPDDKMGEGVHAVVVPAAGAELDLEALQTFCRDRLAGYKLPRSLELVEELPRNATGKILKRDLRAPHWEGLARKV